MKAYCFANGEIGFGRTVPDGAVIIASGPAKKLRERLSVLARHAYDGETLLVPGVPEAPSQEEGMTALLAWCKWAGSTDSEVEFHGAATSTSED